MTRDYDDVKDSGERQEFPTGAMRDTQHGKGRYDLVLSLSHTLYRLARHFENGAVKYGDDNWRKGLPLRRFLDSAFRHVSKFAAGEDDEDHLIAAIWNLCCLCETQHEIEAGRLPTALDDMPHYEKRAESPYGNFEFNLCTAPEPPVPTFYIAGPMRGYDQLNFPMFDSAAQQLAREGEYNVLNPAQMDREQGIDPANMPVEDIDLSEIIRRDCGNILSLNPARGDGMILLPGWWESAGARAEVALGLWMGLNFMSYHDDGNQMICHADRTYIEGSLFRQGGTK